MRIIGGHWKGRKLIPFDEEHIRPTTDRVKESLFNILRNDIPGARVLDLFSGTGNLGLEALSRDAKYVEFVEKNSKSISIIKKNRASLQAEADSLIIQKDVFAYLKSYKGEAFGVIFIDPPFTEELAHSCLEAIALSSVLQKGSLVVIESRKKERVEELYNPLDPLQRIDQREFGDKTAHFFQKQ